MVESFSKDFGWEATPPSGLPAEGGEPLHLFTIRYHEVINRITVELNPNFTMQDWETFMAFVRQKLGEEIINWDLDLRRIPCLSSMLLGAMVTLNMVIRSQQGDLRLIVAKDSRVAQLFVLCKLNRIITVMEI